jgi:dipeptidyl aminopeptidase/acylaminoacyl peptidase
MPPRRLSPSDLLREGLIEEVAIAPDGELVAYPERRAVGGKYRTNLWVVPFRGGRPRRLTHGAWSDSRPRFSPDGRTLAFLSTREQDIAQVWLLSLDGGEATKLTSFKRGVAEAEWLPNGRGLAVLAYDDESHHLVGERDKEAATARVLRRVDWRLDGTGLLDHPSHVHVVPLRGRPRRLTRGSWSAWQVRPHPDGGSVLFLADRGQRADADPFAQIHSVPAGGGRIRQVSKLPGAVQAFTVSPAGELRAVAPEVHPPMSHHPSVVWSVARGGAGTPLTAGLDRFAGLGTTTDLRVAIVHDGGRETPTLVGTDGCEPLVADDLRPDALAVAVAGERVAAVMALGPTPYQDVYAIEPGRAPRRLTRSGDAWIRPRPLPDFEELEIAGPGGSIQTFVHSPPGARARPLATIIEIHGGPTWAWSSSPSRDAVLWAHAGYRVVRPNIRGSYDRGPDWVEPLEGRWGDVDAEDCHAVLDHLVKAGLADPARLGCYGNSYGGFMVNWLVGTSDRFAAAVSSNGVANQVSAYANCDVGPMYNESEGLGTTLTAAGVESLWRQSPLRHVANVTTPLLMLQGEADLRCPQADNEQFFVALRMLGREVEYVTYPESDHSMSYTSRPDRRVDRAQRILGWFRRHMRP